MNSVILETIEPNQFIEITNKLKPVLSAGHDETSSKVLEETIDYVNHPLTQFITTYWFCS